MLVFDLPPPAIVEARPVLDLRLHVNGERMENPLPADFLSMPAALRATVALRELRAWLAPEFRRLPDGLLADLVYAVVPGLPGPHMAGQIRKAWLYTAPGQFRVPGDWNKRDNIIHALGRGANGMSGVITAFYYGGSGGGGGAWAALVDKELAFGATLDFNVAVTAGNTWFITTGDLLADSGNMGSGPSGGFMSEGIGGSAAASIGDEKFSGGDGEARSQNPTAQSGGGGGGAGGPEGAGTDGLAASPGQANAGSNASFNPNKAVDAAPGDGGFGGLSDPLPGEDADLYGGGGGGGGCRGSSAEPGGDGAQGCIFIVNNRSQ